MRAVVCTRYGPPEVLQLGELEEPAPSKNEVRIKVFAAAVTWSDTVIRGFKVPARFRIPMLLAIGFSRPRKSILGMVFSGDVDSVGKAVTRFKAGEAVYGFDRFGFGAYAQYKCIAEQGLLALKPANVNYEEAAALPYGGLIAFSYLRKGNIQVGQRVLVYGASGAVGTSALQLARYLGATVTGVCSGANLELVRSLGANAVIDYTREDFTTRGASYDFIFDAIGKRKGPEPDYQKALRPNGRYISVDTGSPKLQVDDLVLLKELVEAGSFKPVIDRRYPLEQIADAHRYVDQGHKKGNVVVTVQHNGSN